MITAELVRELFVYEPRTGVFTRRVNRGRTKAGDVAGWIDNNGYTVIEINGHNYKAHRLAWLYMTDEWPKDIIDHCDVNPGNNVWANLREATQAQNNWNSPLDVTNTSGLKGAFWHHKAQRWMSQIKANGKLKYLGLFDTKEEAHAAYTAAAESLHGEFARAS